MRIKFIVAGAGLVGYGALLGWALTADHYDRKLDDIDIRVDVLRNKIQELEDKNESLSQGRVITEGRLHSISLDKEIGPHGGTIELVEPENTPEGETSETSVTGEEGETTDETPDEDPEITRSNLQKLIDTYTTNPDDVDTFVDRAEPSTEINRTPPFVISREKYAWDEEEGDEYAKITLTYFPRERLVIDDDEDPVSDVANMLGWRNLSQFGGESGDPDTVFIRNRHLNTDFEVVRETEGTIPLHIKYGMGREEFEVNKAAGIIKFRPEDI